MQQTKSNALWFLTDGSESQEISRFSKKRLAKPAPQEHRMQPIRARLSDLGDLLTVGEVAERLRVSTRCVRGWIADEKLKAVRIATRIRIPSAYLEEMVYEQ